MAYNPTEQKLYDALRNAVLSDREDAMDVISRQGIENGGLIVTFRHYLMIAGKSEMLIRVVYFNKDGVFFWGRICED